jgi:hypothetical protein
MTARTANAVAQASGVPPYVVPCVPALSKSAYGARSQNAPMGNPPPSDLAIEIPSGKNLSPAGVCSKMRWKLWNFPVR